MSRAFSLLALALLLSSCDSHDFDNNLPSGPVVVTGLVVSAETGEPIPNFGFALLEINFGVHRATRGRTDEDGRISFEHEIPDIDGAATPMSYAFEINYPYDGRYKVFSRPLTPPATLDLGTIEIARRR